MPLADQLHHQFKRCQRPAAGDPFAVGHMAGADHLDIVGTTVPAGQTDILASFTYRIAFGFSSTEFGLAGAITLLIFVLVSVISYVNFVAMRRGTEKRNAR